MGVGVNRCPVLRRGWDWTDVGVQVRDAKESVSCEVGCEQRASCRLVVVPAGAGMVASMGCAYKACRLPLLRRVLVRLSIPVCQAVAHVVFPVD